MIVIILRLALLALLVYVVYRAVQFLGSPDRRLKSAQAKNTLFFGRTEKCTQKSQADI